MNDSTTSSNSPYNPLNTTINDNKIEDKDANYQTFFKTIKDFYKLSNL